MAERETVVVDRGTSPLAIIGGIVLVLAVLIVGYMVFFNGQPASTGTVDIDVPAVSVDVVPDGQ